MQLCTPLELFLPPSPVFVVYGNFFVKAGMIPNYSIWPGAGKGNPFPASGLMGKIRMMLMIENILKHLLTCL